MRKPVALILCPLLLDAVVAALLWLDGPPVVTAPATAARLAAAPVATARLAPAPVTAAQTATVPATAAQTATMPAAAAHPATAQTPPALRLATR